MYLLIVFLPLLSSIVSGFFGRFIGKRGAAIITTSSLILTALLSLTAFYEVGLCGSPVYIKLFTWIDSEMFHASWGFLFDSLTVVMLIVVTIVSSLVHLYSVGYMESDPHLPRFMSYLSLFTFFMLMLVTGDNLIQMFLGWEGVGLCSYLLINFWFTRLQANKSAIKAMIMNRIGDFGLSLGIMAIFFVFKSVDFATIFALSSELRNESILFFNYEVNALTLICILLFVGAVGKSSQLGLHTWLPDAMEGPTPVSALIHAATMVTAGVFLVNRCSPLYEYAPTALLVVTFVGAMTAFFAATTGMLQNDLKRVIAYSTCSQLGYMAFACGISNYSVSMFHLMNHAFFKALLFLSAGCVIHALSDEQDMRRMGGLARLIPLTYSMMLIGSLSLMGFPFLTGFYSKDVILEVAFAKYSVSGTFAHWLGTISAFFTAFYSFRLIYLTFLSNPNSSKKVLEHSHESSILMTLPLMILAFGSIFVGYLMKDMFIGFGTSFWGNSLYTHPNNISIIESEFIPIYVKLFPVFLSLLGATMAIVGNYFFTHDLYYAKISQLGRSIYSFLNKRWYFDIFYNKYIGKPLLNFGYKISFLSLDRGVIEVFGPYGLEKSVLAIASRVSKLQTGYIYHYAFIMLIGITFLIAFISLWTYLSLWIDYRLYFILLLSIVILNITVKEE
uniref:NADH-ubiquinone oxidoreductase chain 5 n=1 Tax=Jakoba bahamiensis TaxID=221721 RepID=M4QBZ7_9EUKA|nr:NADH dehydrogenase subunit 5 [Jakoba bahamiensis]AGH24109.1 NADH dehydrogenase subunit 5 [Jakoba bahamiensis]